MAAFANGALAHAFEMDNLTWPNTGVHPGATMAMPALAVAQERGLSGRALIEAVVAGSELMIRVGRATKHNNEGRGFHAPGTTGPFGSAAAVGPASEVRYADDAERARHRRLDLGGAAGVRQIRHRRDGQAAASRPRRGSGHHGGAACRAGLHRAGQRAGRPVRLPQRLLRRARRSRRSPAGSASEWASLRIMLKRFPVHITSHTSVQAIEDLKREHGYAGRRRGVHPRRRQPENGDGEQHPLARRPDDGAILAAVLRRARALSRCARPGLVQSAARSTTGRSAISQAASPSRVGRSQARPHPRLDRLGDAEGRPRADKARRQLQGHAGAAARPRRDAREIPAADAALRRQGDGAAVRAAAEHRGRKEPRLGQGRRGEEANQSRKAGCRQTRAGERSERPARATSKGNRAGSSRRLAPLGGAAAAQADQRDQAK